jgi:hypothetical protein
MAEAGGIPTSHDEPTAPQQQNVTEFQRRLASDPDAKHRAFDSYPWDKDPIFTVGASLTAN